MGLQISREPLKIMLFQVYLKMVINWAICGSKDILLGVDQKIKVWQELRF